jgi:hypothetical protein
MPLQNRVTPLGELVAEPGRGLVYGNRGCLHDQAGRIRRHHNGKRWIACRLHFRDWLRRPLLQPGRFTELFFLDEATALAAGHRACALCRREDYVRLTALWRALHPGQVGADAIDAQLQDERLVPGTATQLRHEAPFDTLPDGAFVLLEAGPHLVLGGSLLRWTPGGYAGRRPRPVRRHALVLTPPTLVSVLRAGWQPLVPLLHPSAFESATDEAVSFRPSRGGVLGGRVMSTPEPAPSPDLPDPAPSPDPSPAPQPVPGEPNPGPSA